jgi:DNA invertase Pin-like site-specific DNA recombinase
MPTILLFMSGEILAVITDRIDDVQASKQKSIVLKYANRKEIRIVDFFYVDPDGQQDQDPLKQTALQDVLLKIVVHRVKAVLVASLDALSKRSIDRQIILAQLALHEVVVLSARKADSLTDSPELEDLKRAMQLTLSLDKVITQTKLQAARKSKIATNGKCGGARPYGSIAGEEGTLDLILQLHDGGHGIGYSKICRYLNEREIAPRRGKFWKPNTIANITGARLEKKAREESFKQLKPSKSNHTAP